MQAFAATYLYGYFFAMLIFLRAKALAHNRKKQLKA